MRLFYSYSHVDEPLRDKLDKHLSALKRTGVISDWHDRKILPGDDFDGKINEHLRLADVILFLVSSDFLASSYIWDIEVKCAMERHNKGEARVIPIILRPVDLEGVPFEHLLRLPKDGLPVTEWTNQDLAFSNVAQGIRRTVIEMSRQDLDREHTTSPEFSVQGYILDYAIGAEIPVGESREVLAMIRRTESPGLGVVLSADEADSRRLRSYSVHSSDVRSNAFKMFFTALSGRFGNDATTVRVELRGPGIDISDSPTTVMVRKSEDTPPLAFLIRSSNAGQQTLKVRVICDDQELINGLLRTSFVHHGGPGGGVGASIERDETGRMLLVLAEAQAILKMIEGGRAMAVASA